MMHKRMQATIVVRLAARCSRDETGYQMFKNAVSCAHPSPYEVLGHALSKGPAIQNCCTMFCSSIYSGPKIATSSMQTMPDVQKLHTETQWSRWQN